MHGSDGIITPSLVNSMSACGPQVETLIYYIRVECSTLLYYFRVELETLPWLLMWNIV